MMLTTEVPFGPLQVHQVISTASIVNARSMHDRIRRGLRDREFLKLIGIAAGDITFGGEDPENFDKR
jgi:hypothetical protein